MRVTCHGCVKIKLYLSVCLDMHRHIYLHKVELLLASTQEEEFIEKRGEAALQ